MSFTSSVAMRASWKAAFRRTSQPAAFWIGRQIAVLMGPFIFRMVVGACQATDFFWPGI
jgi:hypothetical protein